MQVFREVVSEMKQGTFVVVVTLDEKQEYSLAGFLSRVYPFCCAVPKITLAMVLQRSCARAAQ